MLGWTTAAEPSLWPWRPGPLLKAYPKKQKRANNEDTQQYHSYGVATAAACHSTEVQQIRSVSAVLDRPRLHLQESPPIPSHPLQCNAMHPPPLLSLCASATKDKTYSPPPSMQKRSEATRATIPPHLLTLSRPFSRVATPQPHSLTTRYSTARLPCSLRRHSLAPSPLSSLSRHRGDDANPNRGNHIQS